MTQEVRDGEGNQTKLAIDEIREQPIQVEEGNDQSNDAVCVSCSNIALYMCCTCVKYFCQDCCIGHELHLVIKKSEKERNMKCFLDEMMNESEKEREDMLDREEVSWVARVNVKHEMDQSDCYITGLCGLNDNRWVCCDYINYCIKIFSVGSNILQRYVRFGSKPWGVTEIKVKREPTEQGVMSASDISVINQAESDKQCLLHVAVTVPMIYRILFINVTQNPAVITKFIETEKHCWSIAFSEDKIFTLCCDDEFPYPSDTWCVSVMSTAGDTIQTINTGLQIGWPFLAVCHPTVYITDSDNSKVFCMNIETEVISRKTIEGSWPLGISVDPDTNKVYFCAGHQDNIYRLDSSFESVETLLDLVSVNLDRPFALCFYRDRLYVSHDTKSIHRNYVNVVIVL